MLKASRDLFARMFVGQTQRRQRRHKSTRAEMALELLETRALLAAFGSGNLVVERMGDGTTALSSAAAQVSVLEYTPSGTSVQTIGLPGTGADQVTDSGSATSNGYLNSYNGYLGLTGYNSAAGTASVASTNTKVATVYGVDGNRASRTLFPTDGTIYGANNFRSTISTGANTFYATGTGSGTTGGAWYYNGSSFTQVSATGTGTLTNMRNVEIYNNQLYVSSSSGTFLGISSIGSGLPTTSGQTATLQINMGAGASPYGFVMFDTDANGALDLAYVADDRTAAGGGLQKWTFNGSTWTQSWALLVNASNQLSGTAGTGFAGMRGLTGTYANGTATLYATTAAETTNNRLIAIVDSGSTPTSVTAVATAGTNFVFRGVDFTPVAPDTTPPVVSTLSPADNATNVPVGSNLTVTFSESIAKGTGNILIKKSSDNSTAFTIDVTSAQVSVSGATLTIDPASDLADGTGYYVEISGTAIKDLAGNFFAGIAGATTWNFTTASAADTTPPSITNLSPADNSTGAALDTNLVVTFSEDVLKGTGSILVRKTSDDSVVHSIDVTSGIVSVSGNVVTINPATDLAYNTGYYVEIPGTAFKDASSNFYTGTTDKNTWNFTTVADTTAPTLVSMDDGDVDNSVTTNTTLTYTITFSEDIDAATVTAADFDNQGTSAITVGTITETSAGVFSVQITPTSPGTLTLRIPTGAVITDVAGNLLVVPVSDNDTLTVADPDTTPPTVTSIVDDRSGAAINANLPVVYTITFSEDVNLSTIGAADFDNAGTASIAIVSIAEPSPGVVTVTVTPTSPGTLQLRIPTGAVIADTSGNNLVPPVTDDTVIMVNSVTTLTAGDIAFTSFQSDDPDTFSFVLLKNVVDGTQIRFTDNRWSNSGTLATNENTLTLTFQNSGSGFSAGTHFVNTNGGTAPAFRVIGTTTAAGIVSGAISGLSTSGDSLLAYQGAAPTDGASTAWIAGINSRNWSSGATNNESELPTALTNGVNAIQLSTDATDFDNGAFQQASFFGSVDEIRAVVNNVQNWTVSNSPGPVSTTGFTIVTTSSELFISEIVFNPATATDTGEEYIELRGTPNTYLPGTAFLLLIDGDSEDSAGNVDHRFSLNGMQFGSNGFLVLRQFGSTYTVDSGASVMTATAAGWGASWSSRDTDIENGSVSVLLVLSTSTPAVDVDVDANDDGTLDGESVNWTIRDAIGNIDGGTSDTGYGLLNTTGNGNGSVPSGAPLINLNGYHPDYMARNGSSTGYALLTSTATDWVVGELAGAMPNATLATGGFTRPAVYEGAALNHIGATNIFKPANRAPTNIGLSNNTLAENSGANAVVGTLSATDPDSGDTFTFTLPAGVDNNSLFNISGTSLRANASFDFEAGSTYTVTARVTDAGGLTFDKQFSITITNLNESPTFTSGTSFSVAESNTNGLTGPSSSATPYLVSTNTDVQFTSVLTTGDAISGYKMVGIPDGLGAFDNGDGTFTLLMNHELVNTAGVTRAHGGKGAFVSKWIIRKSDLAVLSGSDLIQTILDGATNTALTGSALNLNRLCSADLPEISAFYNSVTGLGTQSRIFLNGEENGNGRAFANVVTGSSAGTTYTIPLLSGISTSWENLLANPATGDKTLVAANSDVAGGKVYFYLGTKQATGTEIDKAGLTNGTLYQLSVAGIANETRNNALGSSSPAFSGSFTLTTGNAGTGFLRPEDGAWDPQNPNDYYFVTTDQLDNVQDGNGAQVGRTRLYRARFSDLSNPTAGGTIEALVDGTEGVNMFDNITVKNGVVILQEDVGNAGHNGKVWQYKIATDTLTQIAQHDRSRFGDVGLNATSPFTQDEESSGVIDVSGILGEGAYLLVVQAHYTNSDTALVEGGQLLMMKTNVASGSQLVTTVTATDPDAGTTLTYSIEGGSDASRFVIDASTGKLSFAVAPNVESPTDSDSDNVYNVKIKVSDGSLTTLQDVQVTVTAINETPVNTTSTAVSVPENTTAVTTVSGTDPEGTTLTYAISGGADAGKFSINSTNGLLSFVSAPNYESPTDNGANNSYFVTVTVSDGVNQPVNRTVVVSVTNVNENPTNIGLSNNTLAENSGANAVIGTLSATDPDSGDTFTFTLPAGVDNNSLFNISGTSLRANASFDFEAGSTYTVTARVTDAGGLTFDKQFSITITNVNENPTNIGLSNNTLAENSGANAVIGTLSATDPDSGDTFTFTLPAGVDNNSLFNISGTSLRANASFDFEAGSTYTVTARVTDAGGLTFDKQFTITISDINEAIFSSNIFYNTDAAAEKGFSPDQTGQRSMIREVQIVFNGNVSIPAGPVSNGSFVATKLGATNVPVSVTVVSSTVASGKTTVVLRFTSSIHSVSGSLTDGNYRLVIDYGVLGIDGDGNGQVGGTRTINFHRFFGDSDGDRDVDAKDSGNYRSALLGASSWRSVFDFDNDGFLVSGGVQDKEDKDAFFANFGRALNPF